MINQAQLLAQLQRGQTLHQAGRFDEAWRAVAPLRAAIADHGQGLRLFALVAQAAGEVDAAVEALRRIIVIEREPPEIVGALADMLGTAGRHGDALPLWTRLTMLQPTIAETHLNRAISASNADRPAIALEAAETGLKHFPGHPRLMATRAMALKNAGRLDEAIAAFEQAVAADPNRALTRHNQALALRAACRFEAACDAYAASERLGMDGAQFHANWAAAELESGRVDGAIEHYRRALAKDPAHVEARAGLTRVQIEYRGGEDAFAHYEEFTTARGSLADWIEYATVLQAHRRHHEAADVAGRAIAMFGEEPALVGLQATAQGIEGDAGAALERIDRAFGGRGDAPLGMMAMLAIRAGQPERAAAIAGQQVKLNPADQGAWAILSIAWRLLDDPREAWLCDYERLVMVTDVDPLDGGLSAGVYAAEVATMLDPLHQASAEPGDQSLRGGTQTSGPLFLRPEPGIQRFGENVLAAAQRAIAGLGEDPAHPFLSRKSERLDFSGSWSVRLSPGGHHVAHMHSQGWMSSAYYARLPPKDDPAAAGRQGWIQFGAPPAMFDLDLAPRRTVEPAPGRLVLFPSYLWHGTLPFDAGDRLTAAFDFVPR